MVSTGTAGGQTATGEPLAVGVSGGAAGAGVPAIELRGVMKRYRLSRTGGGLKQFLLRLPRMLAGGGKGGEEAGSRTHTALAGVELVVRPGEAIGIIGRNGAGKSTLLGIMAGVLRPDAGVAVTRGRIAPLLQLGAGFHPDLTGVENIRLNGLLLGLTRREVDERMGEIIEFAEIGKFIEQPLSTYSTGMQLRLGFSVAAHIDPSVLLIDEVLAVGDAAFIEKCLGRISEFRRRGVTLVLVSHSPGAVARMCERAALLHEGRIVADGVPAEVFKEYHAITQG